MIRGVDHHAHPVNEALRATKLRKMNWDDPYDNHCFRCGEKFKRSQEIAEISIMSHHVLVHGSCMYPGEQVA